MNSKEHKNALIFMWNSGLHYKFRKHEQIFEDRNTQVNKRETQVSNYLS